MTHRMGKSLKAQKEMHIPKHSKFRVAGMIVERPPRHCPSTLRIKDHFSLFSFKSNCIWFKLLVTEVSEKFHMIPFFVPLSLLGSVRTQG